MKRSANAAFQGRQSHGAGTMSAVMLGCHPVGPAPRTKRRLNAILNALMVRELMNGPCTCKDLVVVTGMERRTTLSYLRELHRAKCLHIVGWECDTLGRERSPIYELGEGRDTPRKAPDHHDVTNARYLAKKQLRLVERAA